jgi:hypothetical protein
MLIYYIVFFYILSVQRATTYSLLYFADTTPELGDGLSKGAGFNLSNR